MHTSMKKQANKASKAVKLTKTDFERKIAKNIRSDSKSFYKCVRSKTRVKSTVGPLMDNQGNLVVGDHEMSKMLNMCFASDFTCATRSIAQSLLQQRGCLLQPVLCLND